MISHKLGKWGYIEAFHIEGCGIALIPTIEVSFSFSYPEISLKWWSFHVNISIHKQASDWFMKYIWDFLVNFNWPFKKEEIEEE